MSSSKPWLATYDALGIDWNQIPQLPTKTISDYVYEHSLNFRDRVALVFYEQTITYGQLNAFVDQLANGFRQQGIKKGDVIAVQMPNTPQYVVTMVAAARIGAVITSISPLLTASEVIMQCNDASVKLLFTCDFLYESMQTALIDNVDSLEVVVVSSLSEMLSDELKKVAQADRFIEQIKVVGLDQLFQATPVEHVRETVSLDDVLYLQYTGGTTGRSKGAKLTSYNLLTNTAQANIFYGYHLGLETVASAFPFFHIGGIAVLFNALRMAATFLVIQDPRDIETYCSIMCRFPPTVLANVPTLFQMLMANDAFRNLNFSNLKIAISGAAPFPEKEIKRLEKIIGKNRYCEVYGMTETSPVQTLNPPERFKPGYVGVPLPGTDIRIVDPDDKAQEMPLGEPGEIIVSGPQVMQGYLNVDAKNDALITLTNKTWMCTGDIGFMDEEGYIKVCDRSKDMLIVGGYKVFSVEVEGKLQTLPFVEMSAVVGRPDEERPGNDVVQVYLQLKAGISEDHGQLKEQITEFCRENMAPYKVPKEIFFTKAIPLTSVGKIDKKALRSQEKRGQAVVA